MGARRSKGSCGGVRRTAGRDGHGVRWFGAVPVGSAPTHGLDGSRDRGPDGRTKPDERTHAITQCDTRPVDRWPR